MPDWTPKDAQYWQTLGRGRGMSTGQPVTPTPGAADTAHQFIRDALEQDLPPAVDKWMESLSPWPTVVIASIVVTAIGVAILAVKALGDD